MDVDPEPLDVEMSDHHSNVRNQAGENEARSPLPGAINARHPPLPPRQSDTSGRPLTVGQQYQLQFDSQARDLQIRIDRLNEMAHGEKHLPMF